MIIMSIDPGYALLGFSLLDLDIKKKSIDLVSFGTVTTDIKNDFIFRLQEIGNSVQSLITKYQPDDFAIEKIFFVNNKKTMTNISEIVGTLLYIALQNKLSVAQYTPLEIKLAITSYGKASKMQIQKMIMTILKLNEIPKPDDAADAIACGITHCIKKYHFI